MIKMMGLSLDKALGPSVLRSLERQGVIRPVRWLDDNQGAIAGRLRVACPGLPEPLVERLSGMVARGGGTKAGDNPHNALGAAEHVLKQLKEAKIDANALQSLADSNDIRQLRKQAKELLSTHATEAAETTRS